MYKISIIQNSSSLMEKSDGRESGGVCSAFHSDTVIVQ